MVLVGASVLDVAGDDVVDPASVVAGIVVVAAVEPDTVVGGAAVVDAESDPFPQEAMIIATQLRPSANRRPLTVWTLPVGRRTVAAWIPPSLRSRRSRRRSLQPGPRSLPAQLGRPRGGSPL